MISAFGDAVLSRFIDQADAVPEIRVNHLPQSRSPGIAALRFSLADGLRHHPRGTEKLHAQRMIQGDQVGPVGLKPQHMPTCLELEDRMRGRVSGQWNKLINRSDLRPQAQLPIGRSRIIRSTTVLGHRNQQKSCRHDHDRYGNPLPHDILLNLSRVSLLTTMEWIVEISCIPL